MRTWPPEWTPDLWTGDLWAATTIAVDLAPRWSDPRYTWADPRVTWGGQVVDPLTLSPTGGQVTADWGGPTARTTATIKIPVTTPRIDELQRGLLVTPRAHVCHPSQAPADGNPASVPYCELPALMITNLQRDAEGTLTLTCEDLVTLLGAIELDTGSGPTGYVPTARTAIGVITEIARLTADSQVTVAVGTGVVDAPWSPATEAGTGALLPLTGSLWSAIEDMITLIGACAIADGRTLHLLSRREAEDYTPITITEVDAIGTATVDLLEEQAPAATRVIVTGTDAAGAPIAGRAIDVHALNEQLYRVDDVTTVPGVTTVEQLNVAAAARLQWLRSTRAAGQVSTPWLPMLEPGDLVQVLWATGARTQYVQAISLPLDPLEETVITWRGAGLVTWQDWADDHTWETLRQESWLTRLEVG